MSASNNQDFVTYQGDDVSPIFTVRDANGNPIDISAVQNITWMAKLNIDSDPEITKTKQAGQIVFVTNGADGKFQVLILAADTQPLSGFYIHQASIKDQAGNVSTVSVGRLQVGQPPVWTYNPSKVGTVDLYTVRRIIGDVLVGDQQLVDAEIKWALSQYTNVYLAAAECCRNIAAQYARKVDTVQGDLRTMYSAQSAKYSKMATDLEQRGMARGGVGGYAGGISVQDKIAQEDDSDRVTPQFNIGMDDNLIPLGTGSGNETPGNPTPRESF